MTARAAARRRGAAVEIVIHEGRNRLVRRMCEAVGHPVRRLVRTRIGPLRDRRLAPGEWRRAAAGRGAGALRGGGGERGEQPRRRERTGLTCAPVRLLALRGATTCDEDTKAEIDAKTPARW